MKFYLYRSLFSKNRIRYITMSTSSSFYKTLNSPKFISAPMVDQSELAWRILVRNNGCDLAYTQMILAKSFLVSKEYRNACCDFLDYSHVSGSNEISENALNLEKNVIIQIAGDNPDHLIKVGKELQSKAAAIDLNLGCPQQTAKKGNYGSHLLQNTDLELSILDKMISKLDCPITTKIRIFDDDDRTTRFCQDLEKIGVSLITVHGRTVRANKLFVGSANWDIISKIKQSVSIPIIANGGISSYQDAIKCLQVL
jgi:tRNA-dihydrouridine synthase